MRRSPVAVYAQFISDVLGHHQHRFVQGYAGAVRDTHHALKVCQHGCSVHQRFGADFCVQSFAGLLYGLLIPRKHRVDIGGQRNARLYVGVALRLGNQAVQVGLGVLGLTARTKQ